MSTSVIPTRSAYPFSSVIFSYPFCLLAWRDLRTWHWGVKKFVLALILIRASKRFSWYPVEDFWQCRCWQISSSIEIGGANAEKSCPLETNTKRKITAYSLGRYKHTFYYDLLFFLPVSLSCKIVFRFTWVGITLIANSKLCHRYIYGCLFAIGFFTHVVDRTGRYEVVVILLTLDPDSGHQI